MGKSVPLHSENSKTREMDTVIKKLALLLFVCLCLAAQGQENIVDRLNKTLGVRLPAEYEVKVKTFVDTNYLMKDKGAAAFTEQFIIKEMKEDWGIDRQNQLLFIWSGIGQNLKQDFYTGGDGDEKRLDEIGQKMDLFEQCKKRYRNEFIAYTKQRSEEAKQRSEEAKQRSEEAKQRSEEARKEIMRLDSLWVGNNMKEFYDYFKKGVVKQDEINFMREHTKDHFILQGIQHRLPRHIAEGGWG